MRYRALACDYDGTLAHHGRVDGPTLAALERLLATGRKLLLVTGRELGELLEIFPQIQLFEWVVAENGALLYRPATRQEKLLAPRPLGTFIAELHRRGVQPVAVGRVIVATWVPHETTVLQTIRDLGLELQVIFNKGAVMVLPAGVNKATGLAAALKEMNLSPHEIVGVGDAENDHAFLSACECSVAVANALPAVKERTDIVTRGDHGAGVAELIDELIADDLAGREDQLVRHQLLFGTDPDGSQVRLPPYGPSILIAGPSGSGKSTATASLLERLLEHHYQFCIIDPEGDYEHLEGALTLGGGQGTPTVEEVMEVLSNPEQNAVVNLIGLPVTDRPPFFLGLLPRLQEMRARTSRPHWLIIDEAHHLLPASWEPGALAVPADVRRAVFITVHPDQVALAALATVGIVIAVGAKPEQTMGLLCKALQEEPPHPPLAPPGSGGGWGGLEGGEVLLWPRHRGEAPFKVRVAPGRTERRRHTRKYAEGELPPDRSFYFRGPEGKLNLRAQNLMTFVQLADGVDDETWLHHLHAGDYSRWFRERIKDDGLAAEAETVERLRDVSAADSRKLIKAGVESRYTLPASSPLPMPDTDAAPTRSDPGTR
ncbi:MAG: HAD family hydrolase [Gemmataceae bacterium]|nr:HAD family hydrolase [Gemmataceae bacterium]